MCPWQNLLDTGQQTHGRKSVKNNQLLTCSPHTEERHRPHCHIAVPLCRYSASRRRHHHKNIQWEVFHHLKDNITLDVCNITTWLTCFPPTEKPSKLSCILHYENQATGSSQMLFTCNWEHLIYPSLTINYTVLWWVSDFLSFLWELGNIFWSLHMFLI